jgi:hypothetical protein
VRDDAAGLEGIALIEEARRQLEPLLLRSPANLPAAANLLRLGAARILASGLADADTEGRLMRIVGMVVSLAEGHVRTKPGRLDVLRWRNELRDLARALRARIQAPPDPRET